MLLFGQSRPVLRGERFTVYYRIMGSEQQAYASAQAICLEQSVEFPGELLDAGVIRDEIVGRIESFEPQDDDAFIAAISYAVEISGFELVQLINVIFGNSSIKPGIRVERLDLPEPIVRHFKGPRFGIAGLRQLLGVPARPLLFTALKPMGLSSAELAELAYRFALGGIDVIKDDHGLSDQGFSPYEERVALCAEAVQRANREMGHRAIYAPNITAPFGQIRRRAELAKAAGAGGVLIAPGLTGFDAMRDIADDDNLALPVFSHPAFQGSYVLSPDSGISHRVLFGQLARLAGADATIFPSFGGRFSFSREECESIARAATEPMGGLRPIFPSPAGGLGLASIPESLIVYGRDVMFLIGGGLFRHGPDLTANSRHFRELVEQLDS